MATKVKHRRLRWLGHVIRMEQKWIPEKLRWNPPGKRKQGRPKTLWATFKKIELIWKTAEREAKI